MHRSLVIAVLLLGCLSAKSMFASGRSASELRIVVWQYHMVGQQEYYQNLAQAFEHANLGHRVVIKLEDWNTAHDKIRNWMSAGGGPDLTIVPDVWLAEFASGLDPYAESLPANFLRDFNPTMLDRSRFHGHILGLVWAASTKALFYRTDLFDRVGIRPPSNWQELLAAAQKLSHPPESFGIAIPGAPVLDTADNFYFLLWSNGGHLLAPDGRPSLNTPEAVESLTFLRDLIRKYRVTEPDSVKCDRPCAEELFARGKAAMVETGPWMIRTISAQAKPVPFSVVPLPRNKEAITQLVTDHLVLLRSSRAKPEALRFIKFAYQPSWRLRWARLGMVPELTVVENDRFFADDPVWRVFINDLRHARWIPIVKWEPVDDLIRNMLGEVLAGRVEPAQALGSLSKELQVLLAK